MPLDNLSVDVSFADKNGNPVRASDGSDLTAKFYIRYQTGSGLPASIAGGTTSRILWLIVPAPGAAGQVASGELYFVGATLRYRASGVTNEVVVSPDSILVKPVPNLTLDYFLPAEVYGDDPFTAAEEQPVPFNLGVRVKNSGYGYARKLKINSAQPRIVENELGLLVDFRIIGSEVNGNAATTSLLADFGDIAPNRSGVARWIMISTLSGRFDKFNASYTHSDELGGELTSLLSGDPRTHTLIRDVLVDLPGRDNVRDFLARHTDVLRVYESENADTQVPDYSSGASLAGSEGRYTLRVQPFGGFGFFKLPDPLAGKNLLTQATRADGKPINPANAWLSQTWDSGANHWNYFVNIFDTYNTAGLTYALQYDVPPSPTNRPPHLDPMTSWTLVAGNFLSIPITASDADANHLRFTLEPGNPPSATLDPLTGFFAWRPTQADAGTTNVIRVRVTDDGTPNLSDVGQFSVVVRGNTSPSLQAIPNYVVDVLTTLNVTNAAADADLPANQLFFSLEPGAPAGAFINPTNGLFTWTPTREQAPGTNQITVTVTDNGSPTLTASQSFSVYVNDYIELTLGSTHAFAGQTSSVPLTMHSTAPITNLAMTVGFAFCAAQTGWCAVDPNLRVTIRKTNDNVVLSWFGSNAVPYQVESSTNLSAWTNTSSVVTGGGGSLFFTNPTTGQNRKFYRVKQIFTDTDGDGLPDDWEIFYFGNLSHSASEDADNDGLTNLQEWKLGTTPTNPDTDGDGMPDGWEVLNGLNPLLDDSFDDWDGDRYPNLFEYTHGTSLTNATVIPIPDLVVVPTSAYTNLAAALNAVTTGTNRHPIVLVKPGVYTGATNRNLLVNSKTPLWISEAGSSATIFDLAGSGYAFRLYTNSAIDGFTFKQGSGYQNYGGAIYDIAAKSRIASCVFSNCSVAYDGGAVYLENGSHSLLNCIFDGNSASSDGGSIRVQSGAVSFFACRFLHSYAHGDGGAIYFYSGNFLVQNCQMEGNQADSQGGAIYNRNGALTLKSSQISGNSATEGGALYVFAGLANLANSILSTNIAADSDDIGHLF